MHQRRNCQRPDAAKPLLNFNARPSEAFAPAWRAASGYAVGQGIVVARLNIAHFRRQLAAQPEGPQRQTLQRLLGEEEAKLAALTEPPDDEKETC